MPRFETPSSLRETAAAFQARARELDDTPDMGRKQLVAFGRALNPDIRRQLIDAIDSGELHLDDPSAVVYHAILDSAA
jgi:hypothetical protein